MTYVSCIISLLSVEWFQGPCLSDKVHVSDKAVLGRKPFKGHIHL